MSERRVDRFRNWLAHRIANFALKRIATPWYRDMIGGSIRYGLNAAAEDSSRSGAGRTGNHDERSAL
jgi:hypothetical protein